MNALSASLLLSRRQLHACLAVAMLFVFMPVAPVAAATSPLGFTLGKTTQREVEHSLPRGAIKDSSLSVMTGGPWFEIDPTTFDFDGLEKVVLVFDTDQRLVSVLLTIAKGRFRDVLSDLRSKYSGESQDINNFMQNGKAMFRSGDDWIFFNAPHLSFSLTLTYATDKFWREARRRSEEEATQKRQQERGKL